MTTATLNVYGREADVWMVEGYEMRENIEGDFVLVAHVRISMHGKTFPETVIVEADMINVSPISLSLKEDVTRLASLQKARLSTGGCPICTNMFPFLCDTHRAERNN